MTAITGFHFYEYKLRGWVSLLGLEATFLLFIKPRGLWGRKEFIFTSYCKMRVSKNWLTAIGNGKYPPDTFETQLKNVPVSSRSFQPDDFEENIRPRPLNIPSDRLLARTTRPSLSMGGRGVISPNLNYLPIVIFF